MGEPNITIYSVEAGNNWRGVAELNIILARLKKSWYSVLSFRINVLSYSPARTINSFLITFDVFKRRPGNILRDVNQFTLFMFVYKKDNTAMHHFKKVNKAWIRWKR